MDTQKYLKEIKGKISSLDSYVENEERLLVRLTLNVTSAQLFLLKELSPEQVEKIEKVLKRRMKNEPLTKIFNNAEFMGYDFYVNKDVLSPRKETELLVELAIKSAREMLQNNACYEKREESFGKSEEKYVKNGSELKNDHAKENAREKNKKAGERDNLWGDCGRGDFSVSLDPRTNNKVPRKNKINILDMCCGSGCVGLAIKKILKDATDVTLADLSSDALKVARKNAQNESVKIIKTDMFQDLKKDEKFDIIVCNPPYISKDEYENLSSSVKDYDPKMALVGGVDGLKFYRILASDSKNYLKTGGKIIMEIGYNEREDIQKIFKNAGFKMVAYKDFSGLDRVIVAKITENKND